MYPKSPHNQKVTTYFATAMICPQPFQGSPGCASFLRHKECTDAQIHGNIMVCIHAQLTVQTDKKLSLKKNGCFIPPLNLKKDCPHVQSPHNRHKQASHTYVETCRERNSEMLGQTIPSKSNGDVRAST